LSSVLERYGTLSREGLLEVVARLEGEVDFQKKRADALERRVEELEALSRQLKTDLDKALKYCRREGSVGGSGRKKARKKPGRRAGRGRFAHREAPRPEDLSGPPVDVPLPFRCERCGGTLRETGTETVYNTELPERPRPIVTAFVMHTARCEACGACLRSHHPLVAEDQTGATAHRLGPRAYAAAHALHYDVGVAERKVPRVLELLSGIHVTQGALTRDALWRAEGPLARVYETLKAQVRTRPAVYTDDTGWKVGGVRAFVMGFDTPEETLYQVRDRHTNEEVREIVPETYQGTLISDCARSYDARLLGQVKKQKCLCHLLRLLNEALARQRGRARSFGKTLKGLLKQAIRLHGKLRRHRVGLEQFRTEADELDRKVALHLRPRPIGNKDNERLLREVGDYYRAGHLLRFLKDPTIEPTNNRAERALRPLVQVRNISQGSKSQRGAYATSVFKTLIQTLRKHTQDVIEGLVCVFAGQGIEALHPS
jgi:transposase